MKVIFITELDGAKIAWTKSHGNKDKEHPPHLPARERTTDAVFGFDAKIGLPILVHKQLRSGLVDQDGSYGGQNGFRQHVAAVVA